MSKYTALKRRVYNRGSAPDSFLDELIEWAKNAPDVVFEKNENYDIYSSVYKQLGPWENLAHRKAVMCEVLRVLGGFESSWNWNEGRDITNSTSNTPCTEEAGIFQCSGNSMGFGQLRSFANANGGVDSCEEFIKASKSDHLFALEYCARLLRETVNHHGPVKRKEINEWLSRDCVSEFQKLIAGDIITVPEEDKLLWLEKARSYLGQSEIAGPIDNKWIEDCFDFTSYGHATHDEVPWCAAFLCRVLAESGYKHTHSAAASSYINYGEACDIKQGAIIVFKWYSGQRHVTICDHVIEKGLVACLGGNQSNSVKISKFETKFIEAVRWPVKK